MKKRILAISIMIASVLIFTSCEKDNLVSKPEIMNFELGFENSKIAYLGSDLHMDAEIVAKGKIDKITIEIHPEGEQGKSAKIILYEGEWIVDTTYLKFSGLKNTIFHEHLEIPFDAEAGHYHFHFIVTDMEGQQTSLEEGFEIMVPEEANPQVVNAKTNINTKEFKLDRTITISNIKIDDKAPG